MNSDPMEDTSENIHARFQKGQLVLYEGEEAEVMGVKPLLILKMKDRIICGALHAQIKFIKKSN